MQIGAMRARCTLAFAMGAVGWLNTQIRGVQPTTDEMATAATWVQTYVGPNASTQPFSFVYGESPSTELLKTWKSEHTAREPGKDRIEHTLTWTDSQSGLVLRCVAAAYKDSPAVEWTLYFTNGGNADTPILGNVQALDADMRPQTGTGDFCLYYADGSHDQPADFHPRQAPLGAGATLKLTSYGGRSSDGVMPYFNLAAPHNGGTMIAVGWTGQWATSFTRPDKPEVRVQAGMEQTHLKLHPGETIRTPAILLLFWFGGDRMRGHNLLRDIILRHYTPTANGIPAVPPIAASPHGKIGFNDTTEANMLQCVSNIASHKLPVEYYWIDAGWSLGGFPLGMGNWDPDPARYPNGLKPVADAAHRNGLKFVLWFEPERVMRNTWLHKNHPEWLLSPGELPADLQYHKKDGFFLLNLGNPEALAWTKARFSGMIRDIGVDVYRHDCNLYPLYYWRNGEPPDRQGINEIRYITGLYDFFDTLRRDHPGLIVDNCASGGRRLDFEMARRSLPLWRSDHCWKYVPQQAMTHALSFWLPLHGVGAVSLDPYEFRSGMGASFTFSVDVFSEGSTVWEPAGKLLNELHSLRPLWSGDYYPLTPYSLDNNAWIAWQFNRSDLGQGMIQAFRRPDSTQESARMKLHGLDPQSQYAVTDLDVNKPQSLPSRDLMENGLTISIPGRPGASVITYRRIQ